MLSCLVNLLYAHGQRLLVRLIRPGRHAPQHPYGESDEIKVFDPESTGRAGVVGYIGALPASTFSL
jgi:hypothetical protein